MGAPIVTPSSPVLLEGAASIDAPGVVARSDEAEADRWPLPQAAMFVVGVSCFLWRSIYLAVRALFL